MRFTTRNVPWPLAALLLVAGALWLAFGRRAAAPRYATAALERGDIVETVGATGTLQAVTTVQVGSQVSGTIQSLGADFNSVVKKGQVIARLDPSLFEARLGQARANLVTAKANVDRQKSRGHRHPAEVRAGAAALRGGAHARRASSRPRPPTTKGPWPSSRPARPR